MTTGTTKDNLKRKILIVDDEPEVNREPKKFLRVGSMLIFTMILFWR
jgi:hypothetical protein